MARYLLRQTVSVLMAAALVMGAAACSIEKKEEGTNKNVKIETPFGGMQIKADDKAPADTGLPVYPNARLKANSGHDTNSANVNISSSFFGVKVAAATYQSDDPDSKIRDFYKKELSRYGSVVECEGDIDEKDDALVCGKRHDHDVKLSLGVGNKERRRIVAIKPSREKTEFSLVYVQLRDKEGSL